MKSKLQIKLRHGRNSMKKLVLFFALSAYIFANDDISKLEEDCNFGNTDACVKAWLFYESREASIGKEIKRQKQEPLLECSSSHPILVMF